MNTVIDDYPDPTDRAEFIDENASGDGAGVRRDTLMEARMGAENAAHHLREMYVVLDGMADDKGLLPAPMNTDLREMQERVGAMLDWAVEYREALSEREQAARLR